MKHFAILGAGMAGITAARTLVQAGHQVSVFEQAAHVGGRMATRDTPWGSFDAGAQYFTVRDPRFALALEQVPGTSDCVRPWSANAVRVLDPLGHVVEAALPTREAHFVATPGMQSLVTHWAAPLQAAGCLHLNARVERLARDRLNPHRWQLQVQGEDAVVASGFDAVLLALPHAHAVQLLRQSATEAAASELMASLHGVEVAPCWTLMLAFPQANQPSLSYLGPQWNVARSTHHRIAWLARESSKPRRSPIERWTVQASPEWSSEHLQDDPARVEAKLRKAFAELTGIRTQPTEALIHRWGQAKTLKPLGPPHLYQRATGLGTCGDWHLGHRVEDAFVSGLSLALAVA
jgi:predicted NAD/FAD-dependent oxidoreductase